MTSFTGSIALEEEKKRHHDIKDQIDVKRIHTSRLKVTVQPPRRRSLGELWQVVTMSVFATMSGTGRMSEIDV